jgi:hypothetical protein
MLDPIVILAIDNGGVLYVLVLRKLRLDLSQLDAESSDLYLAVIATQVI